MDINLHTMYLNLSGNESSLNMMPYNGGMLLEIDSPNNTFVMSNENRGIDFKIFSSFKTFITELIGSYHLNDGYRNDCLKIDFINNTIIIKTDKASNDYFKISYNGDYREEITMEFVTDKKSNRVFFDYDGCLKFKYTPAFVNLFRRLVDIKLNHHVGLNNGR